MSIAECISSIVYVWIQHLHDRRPLLILQLDLIHFHAHALSCTVLCRPMRWLISLSKLSTVQLRPHPYWESMVYTDSTHLPSLFALNVIMPILDITGSFVMKKEMTMDLWKEDMVTMINLANSYCQLLSWSNHRL